MKKKSIILGGIFAALAGATAIAVPVALLVNKQGTNATFVPPNTTVGTLADNLKDYLETDFIKNPTNGLSNHEGLHSLVNGNLNEEQKNQFINGPLKDGIVSALSPNISKDNIVNIQIKPKPSLNQTKPNKYGYEVIVNTNNNGTIVTDALVPDLPVKRDLTKLNAIITNNFPNWYKDQAKKEMFDRFVAGTATPEDKKAIRDLIIMNADPADKPWLEASLSNDLSELTIANTTSTSSTNQEFTFDFSFINPDEKLTVKVSTGGFQIDTNTVVAKFDREAFKQAYTNQTWSELNKLVANPADPYLETFKNDLVTKFIKGVSPLVVADITGVKLEELSAENANDTLKLKTYKLTITFKNGQTAVIDNLETSAANYQNPKIIEAVKKNFATIYSSADWPTLETVINGPQPSTDATFIQKIQTAANATYIPNVSDITSIKIVQTSPTNTITPAKEFNLELTMVNGEVMTINQVISSIVNANTTEQTNQIKDAINNQLNTILKNEDQLKDPNQLIIDIINAGTGITISKNDITNVMLNYSADPDANNQQYPKAWYQIDVTLANGKLIQSQNIKTNLTDWKEINSRFTWDNANPHKITGITDKGYSMPTLWIPDHATEFATSIDQAKANTSAITTLDFSPATGLTAISTAQPETMKFLSKLTTAKFDNLKITSLPSLFFKGSSALRTVSFVNCNKLLGFTDEMLRTCVNLTTVDLTGCSSFRSLGYAVFSECIGLTSIDFSQTSNIWGYTPEIIGGKEFIGYTIKSEVFANCRNLSSINFSNIDYFYSTDATGAGKTNTPTNTIEIISTRYTFEFINNVNLIVKNAETKALWDRVIKNAWGETPWNATVTIKQ